MSKETFTMEIKNQEEWAYVMEAVNQGIDSHLEAITERSSFDHATGKCDIHPDEIGCLIRRLKESEDEEAQRLGEDIESVHNEAAE